MGHHHKDGEKDTKEEDNAKLPPLDPNSEKVKKKKVPLVFSKKDQKVIAEEYEKVKHPEVVPKGNRRPSFEGVHNQWNRYTRNTTRQLNTLMPRNVDNEGMEAFKNVDSFRQYAYDHETNRYAHERLPPFKLTETQSDEDLLSFFPTESKKYTWEHFGRNGKDMIEPSDFEELFPVNKEEDAKEAPLGKEVEPDPDDEEEVDITERVAKNHKEPDEPKKPEPKKEEPKKEEPKKEDPKKSEPKKKEEEKKVEEKKAEKAKKEEKPEKKKSSSEESSTSSEKSKKTDTSDSDDSSSPTPTKKSKKSKKKDSSEESESEDSSSPTRKKKSKKSKPKKPKKKKCSCVRPIIYCDCDKSAAGDGGRRKKNEQKKCISCSEEKLHAGASCHGCNNNKSKPKPCIKPCINPFKPQTLNVYSAQIDNGAKELSVPPLRKLKKLKKPCCDDDEGIDFTFRPISGHATEFEVVIEPDEDEPLDFALNHGVAPVICSTLPSCMMQSNNCYNNPYDFTTAPTVYGNLPQPQMYPNQNPYHHQPQHQPGYYPQSNYYYNQPNYGQYGLPQTQYYR